jgi:hypothetical protein
MPFTDKELCPPEAQFVRDVCDIFNAKSPPFFHPLVVSVVTVRRFFSASVTWADTFIKAGINRNTKIISLFFILHKGLSA